MRGLEKPSRQSYSLSACPAGHILKKWVRGRGLMAARQGCVCTGAGHRAPGQGARVGERGASTARCQSPWEGSEQRQCTQGTGRERTTVGCLFFFHKTTHFLAFLHMHGIPDPELSPPHISCIPHLTLQTHRNLGFLSSGDGLTAVLQKG